MAEERVIIYNNGVVVIEKEVFETMLLALPKKVLIDIFACDIETQKRYNEYNKDDIIHQIFIEYEG